ncbi:class I SAM-dependent methyltransferase [Carboxydothermus ferrireducens]|uniref:SAM-dependent methyltransferase n=1 Tax=Carboxydothermus ferrireducens DSM 11255 TaxID=1119529 RepID=A0ABX2R860_9THEO|nr:class I SAM-dependent methyltransferase [Carboxydothermus ferrireducens]NYE57364.1 SAM-dependent methyltransferase [Carboxydothermus ferrireducens DSM 11255]
MGFSLLNRYYDLLFPANVTVVNSLKKLFTPAKKLLDAGCGTGNYALSLAESGFEVTGIDINPEFVSLAREKARGKNNVKFLISDLTAFHLEEPFEGIFCIGNTLPVLGEDGIKKALANFFKHLLPGGLLVGQTVNFALFLKTGVFPFPEKKLLELDLIFRRRYELFGDLVRFSLELVFLQKGEIYTDQMFLYPVTVEKLKTFLEDAGFREIGFYRDFTLTPYDPEGRDLVFTARK